jgi:hypothetical protein
MNGNQDNPCAACATDRRCCTLKGDCGLIVTRAEYYRHFRPHGSGLVTRRSRGFYIISSRDGFACPHLDSSGCRIYRDRPLDCRLFPYNMRRFIKRGRTVKISFHTLSDCPSREALLRAMPETAAREIIGRFGKEVYGGTIAIKTAREKGLFSRIALKIEAVFSRSSGGTD